MPLDNTTAITFVANGATFTVWDEGTKEKFSRDGNSYAIRKIRCLWGQRMAIASAILGGSNQVAGTNLFTYGQPYPDQPSLVADNLAMEGEGVLSVGANGMVAYTWAVITITYKSFYYDQNGIGAEEISFGSIAVATDQTQPTFKWSNGNPIPPAQTPSIKITTMDFTETIQVGVIPKAMIASLLDHRNSTPIFGMAADKVAFLGGRSSRTVTVLGGQNWRLELNFTYNSLGWNKLWNAATNSLMTFTYQDGSDLFPAADLNQLFYANGNFTGLTQ